MKYVIVLLLTTATICAGTPDVKNISVGAGSYSIARGVIALAFEPDWDEPRWVEVVSAGVASVALAGYAGIVAENFQTGDTFAEYQNDTNSRIYGALIAFGVDVAAHAIWYAVTDK